MAWNLSFEGITPYSSEPYPFLPEQEAWLASLESGKFKQGQGVLRSSVDEYCCLGVLAETLACEKKLAPEGTSYGYRSKGSQGDYESPGYLPFEARRTVRLITHLGAFYRIVKFPGLAYSELEPDDGAEHPTGHGSLASMNDVRMIPVGDGSFRAFTFAEIAAYIRFDPWNVFNAPNVVQLHDYEAAA